jgi:hypothetical protein
LSDWEKQTILDQVGLGPHEGQSRVPVHSVLETLSAYTRPSSAARRQLAAQPRPPNEKRGGGKGFHRENSKPRAKTGVR